ncbi:hypothetical protein [Cellulomonas triticagri]|uniref:Uncharacterized protein n=1 Tax=Cellulomonas triticagri TaxID=2483352 RepID=A0A3M2JJ89_9CELL|nr:hypothetical protein [Cellulomonas triticagri]RMI13862.1 hypothetical protein EBM89_02505 [Cellulomonas triticagri]
MIERTEVDVPTPPGGWGAPWPDVAEIEAAFPHDRWTLVGGLMTQVHAAAHGITAVRPTDDVDIVLHVETTRGLPGAAASVLERLGYRLVEPIDPRERTAHRFRRDRRQVDVVTASPGATADGVVDLLIADHAAPSVVGRLRGRTMVAIDGGTQALRRTVLATLRIARGAPTVLSTPSVLGALVLKAAAFRADSRDPGRHLQDAAVLLACLDDPFAAREQFAGSDRSRVLTLARHLPEDAAPWRLLGTETAGQGQAALRILAAGLA